MRLRPKNTQDTVIGLSTFNVQKKILPAGYNYRPIVYLFVVQQLQ